MTLEENNEYTSGDRMFFLRPIEMLELPEEYFIDATQGIHIRQNFTDDGKVYDLKDYVMEKSIGEEYRADGINVLLGS